MSRAVDLVKRYGAVVLSPGYRLAPWAPWPAAMEDCYAALLYLKEQAAALGVRSDQLMVGGESAGGGLCAAVCIRARDEGAVRVAFQMPLYPMLDDRDTESSRGNHGKVWNTRRNHHGVAAVSARDGPRGAARPMPRRRGWTDFSGLPPAYSFVGDGEPFYAETAHYFERLRDRGRPGAAGRVSLRHVRLRHDATAGRASVEAAETFNRQFAYARAHYFAPQREADDGEGRVR